MVPLLEPQNGHTLKQAKTWSGKVCIAVFTSLALAAILCWPLPTSPKAGLRVQGLAGLVLRGCGRGFGFRAKAGQLERVRVLVGSSGIAILGVIILIQR